MSQNGRSRYESGHGSNGIGAFVTAALGELGENGECISLSNRCIPPLGRPSTLNVGALGVGVTVAFVVGTGFRPVKENVVLSGVPRETSEPSGLEMDRVRCFKLRDDLFFLIPAAGPFPFLGEPGTKVASLEKALLGAGVAGVAGEMVKVVSAGLGSGGCDDGIVRVVG
jgi:hypothetical protein